MYKPILNIGILSHVDAGKTTITENFLFNSGAIRKKGSVDDGSTITDSLEIERKRGITVRSTAVSFDWNNTTINLLDTPGHMDFSSEVERILRVLDGAIIVLSAVEGVQAHTISLVEILKEYNIPFIVFINKIDRSGADIDAVISSINSDLAINIIPITLPNDELLTDIYSVWKSDKLSDSELMSSVKESIIEFDDQLMMKYLDGELISISELWEVAIGKINSFDLVPLLVGAAKNNIGLEELLNAVVEYLPKAKQQIDSNASALVYKVENHMKYGKLAHIRVFSGVLKSRDILFNNRLEDEIKIGILKKINLNKLDDINELKAGEIGVLSVMDDIQVGDIFGDKSIVPKPLSFMESVMTTVIKPSDKKDFADLNKALIVLDSEDPALELKWYKSEQEFQVKIIGPIQIEVLEDQLRERFNLEVIFEKPSIIYKERPKKKAEGFVRYWMPKPCWAIMTFEIKPGEIGSGTVFNSEVRQSDIHQKYQNEVKRTIPKVLEQGIKGWQVTDIIITLKSGEDHNIHSRPGDFELATYMGIMRALDNAETELLEPILEFTLKIPEELLGKVASDLTRMRAKFANPEFENEMVSLKGSIPAATSLDYSIRLSSLTSGRGRIRFKLKNYDVCPINEGVTKEYKGVNPLDEAQWILHRRGAYKADERKL